MSNANAGHIKTDENTAGGQNVHEGLDFVEKIESMIGTFVTEERERATLHDGRITSLEDAFSLVKVALRAIDDQKEAGQKFTAAGWGEARDKALAEVGRTCHAAYLVHKGQPVDRDRYEADMSGSTAAGGGAQIPKLVLPEIIRFMEEASLPRLTFNKLQMENRSIDFPVKTSGPLIFWPDEGKSPWATTPLVAGTNPPKPTAAPAGPTELGFPEQGIRLTAPTLNAKTVMAVDKISGEYLEDAVSNEPLMTVLGRIYLEAMASEETRVALVGNASANDPFNGVVNTAGIGSGDVGSLTTNGGIPAVTELLSLMSKVEDVTIFGEKTIFIVNTKAFTTKIMGLQAETSTPIYLHNFNSSVQQPFGGGGPPDPLKGAPGYLLGKPIYCTKHLPDGDTATEPWIVIVAADRCWMGIRRGVTVDFSPLPFWTSGSMGIRVAQRIGFLFPQPTAIAKGLMAA